MGALAVLAAEGVITGAAVAGGSVAMVGGGVAVNAILAVNTVLRKHYLAILGTILTNMGVDVESIVKEEFLLERELVKRMDEAHAMEWKPTDRRWRSLWVTDEEAEAAGIPADERITVREGVFAGWCLYVYFCVCVILGSQNVTNECMELLANRLMALHHMHSIRLHLVQHVVIAVVGMYMCMCMRCGVICWHTFHIVQVSTMRGNHGCSATSFPMCVASTYVVALTMAEHYLSTPSA